MTRDEAITQLTGPGQTYELIDLDIQGRQLRVFRNAPNTLGELFASTVSNLPFLIYEDERFTFAQAHAAAARIAQVLVQHCGVKPGDRVAIALRNYPEWVLAFTAVTSIGAVAVAMNGHWQAKEMAYGLIDSGAKVLIADAERVERWAQCDPIAGLQVLAVRAARAVPGITLLSDLTNEVGEVAMPDVRIEPDDSATILYTSGSTGHPKGVVSSHRNILSALLSWELDRNVGELMAGLPLSSPKVTPTPEPTRTHNGQTTPAEQAGTLLCAPLFHVTGLHASYLSSYRSQRKMACMYRWDAEKAAALIDAERLTSVVAPAAMTGDLVRVAKSGAYKLDSLQIVGGGGAPRAPEQVRQIDASFSQALPNTGWGMTETNAIGTGIGGEDYLTHPASSGRCSQVLQIKVVNERGDTLPVGERGELMVRGTSVFRGYWNRPEVNAQVFDGDWFRTGDVATIDTEGFLYIVDRIKDLIIRGGENISCGQVEAALLMHPGVHEASVYAVPDERLGEEVGATVFGAGPIDAEELRNFLSKHLARFEVPRFVQVSKEPLLRTPSGKILKREIRQAALAEFLGAGPPG